MIESNLIEGNQSLGDGDLSKLTHGQSVTDACISWETTEEVLADLATAVQTRRRLISWSADGLPPLSSSTAQLLANVEKE